MEHQNSHDPLTTLPFRVIHFPLFAPPGHNNNNGHKPLLHYYHNLLVHEKEVLHVSGTYHSPSIYGYQLSIARLVDKHKTSRYNSTYMEGYYHATYHHSFKNPTRSAQYITCI
jgi:hypothetical protein